MYIRVYYQSTTQTQSMTVDQSHDTGPVTVYQDNTSMMALIARGKTGAERSQHKNKRLFWLHDKVKAKEGTIVHLGTKEVCLCQHAHQATAGKSVYVCERPSQWMERQQEWVTEIM